MLSKERQVGGRENQEDMSTLREPLHVKIKRFKPSLQLEPSLNLMTNFFSTQSGKWQLRSRYECAESRPGDESKMSERLEEEMMSLMTDPS